MEGTSKLRTIRIAPSARMLLGHVFRGASGGIEVICHSWHFDDSTTISLHDVERERYNIFAPNPYRVRIRTIDPKGRTLVRWAAFRIRGRVMIAFACPHCDKPLHLQVDSVGTMVLCPACGKPILVPAARVNGQSPKDDAESTLQIRAPALDRADPEVSLATDVHRLNAPPKCAMIPLVRRQSISERTKPTCCPGS